MLSIPKIQEAVKKIAPEYSIKTVNVFGSYAEGTANPLGKDSMITLGKVVPIYEQ